MTEDSDDPLADLARGYVPLTADAKAEAWRDGTVVLDANVLLNLYRYSAATRLKLLDLLERISDRLWIPNQSASEYFRQRARVITEQLTASDQLRARLDGGIDALLEGLREVHRGVGRRDVSEGLTSAAEARLNELRDELLREEAERLPAASLTDDAIHAKLVGLIGGRVGSPYSAERLKDIEEEAVSRYERKIPPGYLDSEKDTNRFGDVILWYQTIDHAADVRRPVILVSDDQKEDWIWVERGRKLGPRPELVRELHDRAKVPLLLYTTSGFIEAASEALESDVDHSAIAEAEHVALATRTMELNIAPQDVKRLEQRLRDSTISYDQRRQLRDHLRTMIPAAEWSDFEGRPRGGVDWARHGQLDPSFVDVEVHLRVESDNAKSVAIAITALGQFVVKSSIRITSPDERAYSTSVRAAPGHTSVVLFPEDFSVVAPPKGSYDLRIVSRTRDQDADVREIEFVLGPVAED